MRVANCATSYKGWTCDRFIWFCIVIVTCTAAASALSVNASSRSILAGHHSRRSGVSAAHNQRDTRWLRLSGRAQRKKRKDLAALYDLLDNYADLHKRCLFDDSYESKYVIVSMGDGFSGK